jgi:hypothetical protein
MMAHEPTKWPEDVWKGHYSNEALVGMPFLWQTVGDVTDALRQLTGESEPVEAIAFNFGKWESQIARNASATDCHGHCHIVLTATAHEKLSKLPGWEALRGRNQASPNYELKDALKLERKYLMSEDLSFIRENMLMKSDLEEFKVEMKEMKHDLEGFRVEMKHDFEEFKVEMKHYFEQFKREILQILNPATGRMSYVFSQLEMNFADH